MHFENKMLESAETSFKKHCFAKTKYETVASICALCNVYWCKIEMFMVFAFEAESGLFPDSVFPWGFVLSSETFRIVRFALFAFPITYRLVRQYRVAPATVYWITGLDPGLPDYWTTRLEKV